MKKDNSTYRQKVALRQMVLNWIDEPIVLEAYGGNGKLFNACYSHIARGVVIEKTSQRLNC